MLRILMLLLGIYLILYGTTNKYLAIPCSTIGALLVIVGLGGIL
jgi:hypothetical protein